MSVKGFIHSFDEIDVNASAWSNGTPYRWCVDASSLGLGVGFWPPALSMRRAGLPDVVFYRSSSPMADRGEFQGFSYVALDRSRTIEVFND